MPNRNEVSTNGFIELSLVVGFPEDIHASTLISRHLLSSFCNTTVADEDWLVFKIGEVRFTLIVTVIAFHMSPSDLANEE
jgi:hypothetical protein